MSTRVSDDSPPAEAPDGDLLQPEQHAGGPVRITTERSGIPSTSVSSQELEPLSSVFSAINSRGEPTETGPPQPGQHYFMSTGVVGAEFPVRQVMSLSLNGLSPSIELSTPAGRQHQELQAPGNYSPATGYASRSFERVFLHSAELETLLD
jgi:hypothetical protein